MTRSAFDSFDVPESSASISDSLYGDAVFTSSFGGFQKANRPAAGDQIAENSCAAYGEVNEAPLLDPSFRQDLDQADVLRFSTPVDNEAAGESPDYRAIIGTDGQLRLEPVGVGESLADGTINIEIDAGSKSLAQAIKNADKNLKEYIREMMSYWSKSNPHRPYPSWWQAVLDSQPNIPDSPSPVSIQATPRQYCPQPDTSYQPPTPPKVGWQPDYRRGKGPGYGSGEFGGGYSNRYHVADRACTDHGGYYGGADTDRPALPNYVPDYNDSTSFIDRLSRTIMRNEGALKSDGSPNFSAYNADDNGGISVGIRQWHAGGALPELLKAFKQCDSQKFEQYFHGQSPAQINAMNASEFSDHPRLVEGMKAALADPAYQKVQLELMENWVKREVKIGMDLGLTGERELATFVDISNQYGQSRANQAATIGRSAGDQSLHMHQAICADRYGERFARIEQTFGTDLASLEPRPAHGNESILSVAAKSVGEQVWRQSPFARYCEAGNKGCAASVSEILQAAGYEYANDAGVHNLVGILKNNGWREVSLSQAQPGDVLWNSHHVGLKALAPNMIFDNSSRTGQWAHRAIGASGLSDGTVHALRPPAEGTAIARRSEFT